MRTIDGGVREAVALLNAIPGVQTRASCEGMGRTRSAHRHADLAYVLLQHPFPLELQAFLLAHLDRLARIESDGVYSLWPGNNHEFLLRLADAARVYARGHTAIRQRLRVLLAPLRARLARHLAARTAARVGLCTACPQVAVDLHIETHAIVPLFQLPPDQADQWFADFVAQSGNRLDPQLIQREGWEQVVARTHHGDFGQTFHQRWLRYRSRRLADLTTHQLRLGVEGARRRGSPVDFYFDRTHAHFAWAG